MQTQLASIDAVRPVFLIVMGAFLLLVAWRLAKNACGWTARLIVSGAILLAFGYMLLLPFYEAGKILTPSHPLADPSTALAWHAVKLTTMNCGWLLFGLGLAMHAKLFRASPPAKPVASPTVVRHGTVA